MSHELVCFHGHRLESIDSISNAELVCPLCGSLTLPQTDRGNLDVDKSDALAVTAVPVSGPNSFGNNSSNPNRDIFGSSPNPSVKQISDSDSGTNSDSGTSSASGTDSFAPTMDIAPEDLETGDYQPPKQAAHPKAKKPTQPKTIKVVSNEKEKKHFDPPSLPGVEVMEELGRGGMGIVYRAYDEKHGRDVALKTLQRMSPDDLVRFKREFRALADIAHPNLASLFELLSDGKTWCFTMEILKGVELLEYVWSEFEAIKADSGRKRPVESAAQTARLSMRRMTRVYDTLKQLAIGLNALHRGGKLHSDIKPSNVLVTTEGRLVLLDFGLIAEISRDKDGRVPRVIQGTPHYMSPEQAACRPLTGASDWYAVGVMLYEVLTGRLPFRDKSVKAMLRKQFETPVGPDRRQPDTPKNLNDLCMAMLEIDPAKRPSAVDVLRAIDEHELAESMQAQNSVGSAECVELVGRERHYAELNQAYAEVVAGDTRSVFVHGFSGMGKSVLIRSFLDRILQEGATIILEGRCYEQESVPFKTLDSLIDALVIYLSEQPRDEVQALVPHDSRPLAKLFPVLGQLPGADDDSKPTVDRSDQFELRQRAMEGLRELLTRIGKKRPLVLYIDDLQWGDDDSANLLADLVRPPDGPRLLLLGSYRREDVGTSSSLMTLADAYQKGQVHPHRHELAVDHLSHSDSVRLAAMLLGNDNPETRQLADRIGKESGGSPFFVWELVQHTREDSDAQVGSLELDEVIWSRVLRLPEGPRRLLEVFAVAGRPMRAAEAFQTIDEMTHGPSLLAQLRTNNFIRTTESDADTIVMTYHDRIRESVVNHLATAKVRGHHLKLALVIEQAGNISVALVEAHIRSTPDFEERGATYPLDKRQWQRVFDLAYFFDAADKRDRALPYALIAAERAWSQNALDVAEQQYEIARRAGDTTDDARRFRIAEGLGDVLMMRGQYERADQHFQSARSLAKGNDALARIDGKRGYLYFKKSEMGNSATHFKLALTELGNSPPSNNVTQVIALLKEGACQVLHTYFPKMFTKRRPSGTEQARKGLFRARLYDGLGYPYWFTRGPIPTLWTHLRHMNLAEKYPPSQELGRSYAMHAVMMTAVPLAARGAAYAEKAYHIHGELGDRLGQGKARSFQTFSYLTLGRFKEGVETGREAVRLLEQAGDVWEANMARIILSQPLYFLGDLKNSYLEAKLAYEKGLETGDFSAVAIALYFWAPSSPHTLPEGALQREWDRVREDPLSSAAAIQGRGQELLLREDNPREAARVIQESLNVAKRLGLRNPCIFCGVSWKATALRVVAEREPEGSARRTAIGAAKKSVRDALKITKSYLTCRPRALREAGIIAGIERQESKARQFFDQSLQVATQQSAAYEHAQTLLAQGQAGQIFGWPNSDEQVATGKKVMAEFETF